MFFKFSIVILSLLFSVVSCQNDSTNSNKKTLKNSDVVAKDFIEKIDSSALKTKLKRDSIQEQKMISSNLVDIQTVNPTIKIDLKYATEDNFMKQRLYFDIDKVYLQKDVAEKLSKVQEYLQSLDPNLSLLVYDGVRPLSVQKAMWKALDTMPVHERLKFVSNPVSGSIHNYGAAIDLTICNRDGKPLDMGAGYDDIRLVAYPSKEAHFLQTGELSVAQVENRKLLRKIMKYQGFSNISTEWWHFNACSRVEAKRKYRILE